MITDLLSVEASRDPFPVYRALRDHAPVTWLPEHRAWFVASHAAVLDAFRHPALSSDRLTPVRRRLDDHRRELLADTFDLLDGWMVFHDPPQHERLRLPLRRAFLPRTIDALRPFVEHTVDRCVDLMAERLADGETVDVVAELAFPIPAIVIAELLGVPASDRDEFKTWSADLATVVFGTTADPRRAEQAARGTRRFVDYFTALVADRERHPGDDLISALVAARDEADPPIGAMELVGACTLLLFGGHETTTSLITLATHSLSQYPDQRSWLVAHPDAVVGAVEELHRFDGPSKVMVRVAHEPLELAGTAIDAGRTVFLGLAAANRDPAAFEHPDELRLDRADAHRHLGFGHGIHHCLGAPLARLETQVAVDALVRRLGDWQLAVDPVDLVWGATVLGRGLGSLPIARG
ncbi:MAG: cytochrome P450 [Acidimicrobiales bacterium]